MSNLTLAQKEALKGIDSREVAEMTGKRHADLMRDIRGYIDILDNNPNANLHPDMFFIENTYLDTQNQERPCYLLTRKGCDMVANKMTGEKGVLFTAAYVTKFEEMERAQKQPSLNTSELSPQLQLFNQMFHALAANELELKKATTIALEAKTGLEQAKQVISNIKETIITNHDNWREEINRMVNKIAMKVGQDKFREVRKESYTLLEQRAHVDLNRRLFNHRARMLDRGLSKTAIDKSNYMDIIEADPKLREIYAGIIKEMTIKHVA